MQGGDLVPDGGEHPLHLVELSLRDHGLRQGRAEHPKLRRLRGEIPQVDPGGEGVDRRFRQLALHQRPVPLCDVPPGAQQAVVQLPVARQDQQPRRILVQPAHRHAPDAPVHRRQQVHHRGLLRVARGGQEPPGLVHHHMAHDPPVDLLPVQGRAVFLRLKRKGGIPDDPPVHRGLSAADPFPDLTAAAEGQRRQPTVQPHFHRISSSGSLGPLMRARFPAESPLFQSVHIRRGNE